jgi:hypothetical protein
MSLRKAVVDDVNDIAALCALKREQYEKYQPVFHHEADGALEIQTNFLKDSITRENVIALINVDGDVRTNGFIIGAIVNSPPVYNPGGKVCFVDDFMVLDPSLWATVGKALLDRIIELSKEKGAVLANVVCGPLDKPKKDMLQQHGFGIATEWNIKIIK